MTALELARTPQPHYNIPQMTDEDAVYKSMFGGRSRHSIVASSFLLQAR